MSIDDTGCTGSLVTRLNIVSQQLQQADGAHPRVLDTAVVVLAVLTLCLPDLLPVDSSDSGPDKLHLSLTELPLAATLALQAGLMLPLLLRRRKPLMTFAAITTAFVLQWSLDVGLRADLALFLALYSLALHGRLPQLPWACAVTAGAMVLVALRLSPIVSPGDALFFLLSAVTAAIALGLVIRIRRAQLAGLRERAEQLEIERDQRSKLAAAAERARAARDMHDIVGHNLAVIVSLADAGAYATDSAPDRGREALNLIGDTGRQALGELRRVLGVLREPRNSTSPEPCSARNQASRTSAYCAPASERRAPKSPITRQVTWTD
ncbi:histidine kinase [Actinacidiphila guanduensis]|uniref:histidine kinase n=1 Tax=Actinacidiphila guanduensis TaxID=310781 RepID=UPI000A41BBCE